MAMKRLLENFQKYINEEELEEATRASKEGVVLPSVLEKLEKYVVSDNEEPTHFFQFSDINKLGVNPRSKYNTPMGIYAYPLIRTLLDQYKSGSIPFASQRKYVIIFKANPRSNVLFAREGEDPIGDTQTENMIEFLYSREAAMLTGNPELYKEASAYIHGDIFWYYNDPLGRYSPGPEKDEIHETLDLMVDEFLNWSTNILPSNVSDTLWADLMDEYEDVIGSASLGSTRSEDIRSILWNIVEYIIKDWGSFPFGQIPEYEEIIKEFKALVLRKKVRRLKQRNNFFSSSDSVKRMEDYKRQVSRLEDTIFTVNHYAILKAWLKTYYRKMEKGEATTLGRYSVEAQMTAAKNPKPGVYIEMLNLEEFANLNKQIRKSSWEKSMPGLNNPPSVSAIQMTDSWKVMTTKSNNKTNLGMLWYGSMLLAGNISRSMDQKHGHGMKVWRTILQKLWGIDGVVDMGSVGPDASGAVPIIHNAEPTQAVFFSKSAIQHVTTLKNTETPKALVRRKKGKQKLLTRLIASSIEQEWNQLYADHITDMTPMDDSINSTFAAFSVDELANRIFYNVETENRIAGHLEDAVYDRSLWKKVSNISLDELHNAKIDPTTVQPIEQNALLIRADISYAIFTWWLRIVRSIIQEKMKKVYSAARRMRKAPFSPGDSISVPWDSAADFSDIMKHIDNKVIGGSRYVMPHTKVSNFNKADLLRYINKTVNFHNLVNKIYLSSIAHQSSGSEQAANEMTKLLARRPYTELGL